MKTNQVRKLIKRRHDRNRRVIAEVLLGMAATEHRPTLFREVLDRIAQNHELERQFDLTRKRKKQDK